MRISLATLLISCLLMLLIPSCSIEKRRYTGGFHIDRIGKAKESPKPEEADVARQEPSPSSTSTVATHNRPSSATEVDSTSAPTPPVQRTPAPKATPTAQPSKSARNIEHMAARITKRMGIEGRLTSPEEPMENTRTSPLAIASMIVAFVGFLLIFVGIVAFESWASIGYIFLGVFIIIISFILGILTFLIDKRKQRKIPVLFYVVFALTAIISLWVLGGLLLMKLGVI